MKYNRLLKNIEILFTEGSLTIKQKKKIYWSIFNCFSLTESTDYSEKIYYLFILMEKPSQRQTTIPEMSLKEKLKNLEAELNKVNNN